jgi:hypothetical protein
VAAEKLAKGLADRDRGLAFDSTNLTSGRHLVHWLEDSVQGSVNLLPMRPTRGSCGCTSHPRWDTSILRRLRRRTCGHCTARNVKPDSHPGPSSNIHAVLNRALKAAVNDGLILRSSCKDVGSPKVQREEIQYLTREEVRAFFEAAREDRLEALYVLAVTNWAQAG